MPLLCRYSSICSRRLYLLTRSPRAVAPVLMNWAPMATACTCTVPSGDRSVKVISEENTKTTKPHCFDRQTSNTLCHRWSVCCARVISNGRSAYQIGDKRVRSLAGAMRYGHVAIVRYTRTEPVMRKHAAANPHEISWRKPTEDHAGSSHGLGNGADLVHLEQQSVRPFLGSHNSLNQRLPNQ